MSIEDLEALSRRDRLRLGIVVVVVVVAVLWITLFLMRPAPSRHIVMTSGAEFGLYHQFAQRYKEILAREGVTVEERMTSGAAENLRLLTDPKSDVDVAFLQGGIGAPMDGSVVMVAALYYEPLWIFYRDARPIARFKDLDGKRVAVGAAGSGTRAVVDQLLAANGLTIASGVGRGNTDILSLGGSEALNALKSGDIDAALFVGGVQTPLIKKALIDPALSPLSMDRAEAYPRRFPFLTRLQLPRATVDLAIDIPHQDVVVVATRAMLAARDDLHPALVNLLLDAASEVHAGQGVFEAAGEFPNTAQVDLPVAAQAERHKRFGPSLLYRYLPFWIATLVERAIVLVVPVIVILIPLLNYMPQILRWRVRSRIFRWYGELALLENEIRTRAAPLPIEQWTQDLDRIERAAGAMRPPSRYASEVYTLREHIGIVRQTANAKAAIEQALVRTAARLQPPENLNASA